MFVILFPVVEECLFRGFVLTGLWQSWRSSVADMGAAVLFVAVYLSKMLK